MDNSGSCICIDNTCDILDYQEIQGTKRITNFGKSAKGLSVL